MRQFSESDSFVVCSEQIVLECSRCGERLILLGFESDWYSEGRTVFECECGEKLTLADRIDGETARLKALLRHFK
jgi:hypothetical protein